MMSLGGGMGGKKKKANNRGPHLWKALTSQTSNSSSSSTTTSSTGSSPLAVTTRKHSSLLYLTVKPDYLVLRAPWGAQSTKTQQALDPILLLRAPPTTPRSRGPVADQPAQQQPPPPPAPSCSGDKVTFQQKDFQTAVRDGDMLGNEEEREIQGVLGLVYLLSGAYLLTIESSVVVGSTPQGEEAGGAIHRVLKMGIVPVSRRQQQQHVLGTPAQRCDEERYLRMLQAPVVSGALFFSPQYPLHRSLHKNARVCPDLDFDSTAPLFWGEGDDEAGDDDADDANHTHVNNNGGTSPSAATSSSSSQYLWNGFLLSGLEGSRRFWGTACISGFASSRSVPYKGGDGTATLTLISRRSTKMQGTRFHRRGANASGEVANFVETEVLLRLPTGDGAGATEREEDGEALVLAHVQVRGSIPLPWTQEPNLRWQPPVRLAASSSSSSSSSTPPAPTCAQAHFLQQLAPAYGDVLAINLIDSCGATPHEKAQAELGRLLAEAVKGLPGYTPSLLPEDGPGGASPPPRVSLVWFDFHKECKRNRLDKLDTHLLTRLDSLIGSQGWTALTVGPSAESAVDGSHTSNGTKRGSAAVSPPAGPSQEQTGVVRTNCIDNLDRTNVVQSLVARRVLRKALAHVQAEEDAVSTGTGGGPALSLDIPALEQVLKEVWVANADALSTLYAGTPALKTDFVLTGHQTSLGMLRDGLNAVTRYYINNFWDGWRQDCVALWLGEYVPPRNPPGSSSPALSPFPPYRLPFCPGGLFFTLSIALQELAPYQLTLQVGALATETVVSLAQAMLGLASEGKEESFLIKLLFCYTMFLLLWFAFWECVLFLGPFKMLRILREQSHLLVDRPRLVQRDGGAPK